MSLKGFHIVFIVLAALLSLGFAAWISFVPQEIVTGSLRVSGWLSGAAGVSLVLYGIWFVLKKSRKIIV
ncbi:MAG: hypothetical protein ACI9R3_003773 [Verrucomicrobiales bacterium]|jgi:hypothetical protein